MTISEPIRDPEKIREAMEDTSPEPEIRACGGVVHTYMDHVNRMRDTILSTDYRAREAYRNDAEFKVTFDILVNGIRRTVSMMAEAAEKRQREHRRTLDRLFYDQPKMRYDLGLIKDEPMWRDILPAPFLTKTPAMPKITDVGEV